MPGYGKIKAFPVGDVCSYIVRRTQIYLEDAQSAELGRRAAVEGKTKSELIREAIDGYLGRSSLTNEDWKQRWVAAIEATAGIAPYMPAGADYVDDARRGDSDRQQRLDERWRR